MFQALWNEGSLCLSVFIHLLPLNTHIAKAAIKSTCKLFLCGREGIRTKSDMRFYQN